MAINQGFGALAEFALLEHSDDVAGSSAIGVADSLLPVTAEAYGLTAALLRTDQLALVANALRAIAASLARQDALPLTAAGTAALWSVLTTRADELSPMLADSAGPAVTLTRQDATSVQLDAVVAALAVKLNRTDSCSIVVNRPATGVGFGALLEFALLEHNLDTNTKPSFGLVVQLLASLSRDDDARLTLSEVVTPAVVLSILDEVAAALAEATPRTEERLHRRITNVIQY